MLHAQVKLCLPAWVAEAIDHQAIYPDAAAQIRPAIELARRNVAAGTGGPFGAAVFNRAGRLISVGVNRVTEQNCSLAHAEIMAFMTAQARLRAFRLNADGDQYTLATSAQPCCQCYGASFWAGIDNLLIGARAEDVQTLTEFDEGPLPPDWVGELERRGIRVQRDLMREQARQVLADYRAAGGPSY